MANRFNSFRRIALLAQSIAGNNPLLERIEKAMLSRTSSTGPPPLFIIGAPRTGSTLLFQLLLARYRFVCLTNIQSFFYASPVVVGRLLYPWIRRTGINTGFSSKYGYIKGTFSPSEAGRVFARWFGEIGNSSREPGLKKEMVRGSVYFLSTLFGCPFLAKNLNNSLRLRRIRAIFPEGVFVWVKRDPLFVCQSILEMRRTVTGSDHHWVSVTPLGYEKLSNRSPLEQVAWQVATIEKNIEHDLSKGQMEKVIPVDYESLCEEPQKVLRDICFFYERVAGIPLEETGTRIHSLKPSNRQRLSGQEWKLLKSYVEQYSGKKSRISSVNDKQQ